MNPNSSSNHVKHHIDIWRCLGHCFKNSGDPSRPWGWQTGKFHSPGFYLQTLEKPWVYFPWYLGNISCKMRLHGVCEVDWQRNSTHLNSNCRYWKYLEYTFHHIWWTFRAKSESFGLVSLKEAEIPLTWIPEPNMENRAGLLKIHLHWAAYKQYLSYQNC